MSIFVDVKERVEIKIYYRTKDGKIEILEDKEDKCDALTVKFATPDYNISQRIIQSCTRQSESGGSSIDLFALQQNMLIGLAREWDAKDDEGKDVPLTPTTIGTLRVDIAKALIAKLMEQVGSVF